LRQIQSADYATVNTLFTDAFDVKPPKEVEYIANLCATDPEGCLIAMVGGEAVGYACTHVSGSIGYIGTIAVANAHRGKGYGKALTEAVRDSLSARCDVVGLAVEPDLGRNLQLYSSSGFVATMPACFVWRQWKPEDLATPSDSVRSAAQLGGEINSVIERVRAWSDEVFSGLDFTQDLTHFARTYPERIWFDMEEGEPRGFLANEPLFRGDVWGCVRPGPGDLDCLDRLIDAVEAASTQSYEWFHFHSCFARILPVLQKRGYRITGHKTVMMLPGERTPWPASSDSILIRPWWT
jgi:GNAT superfamily N-acetyltransferase